MAVRPLSNSVVDRTSPVVAETALPAGEHLATVEAASCLDTADTDWEHFPENPVPDLAAVQIVRSQVVSHSIDREHLQVREIRRFAVLAPATAWAGGFDIAAVLADTALAAARFDIVAVLADTALAAARFAEQ